MSDHKDTGGPAFPTENGRQTGPDSYHYEGMALRDWFAATAPQECVNLEGWSTAECAAELGLPDGTPYTWRKHYFALIAKLRYEYADFMLKARL